MKELTRGEEQIMQILWDIEKGFVKDVVERFPEPKPAYNTVSTLIRILENKGFVNHEAFGKTYRYFPAVDKKDYTQRYLKNFMNNYFGSSFKQLVSFFADHESLSVQEIEEIKKMLDEEAKKQKK